MARSTHSKATTALALASVALLSSADIATAQDGFRRIATDFDDSQPTGVVLPSICIGNFMVPKTMYTFEPAGADETNVTILTNPPDLVETGYDADEGLIYFKFNQEISELADDAGVIIKFPPGQLESVKACCSQSVQIKEGFTKFQSLTVSTKAVVNATFAVEQESDMIIDVQASAEINVKVTGTADNKVAVTASDKAMVKIAGDITSLSCSNESSCKVAGTILEPAESGANGESTIMTESCEGVDVKKDSTCESKSSTVRVVTSGALVISGVKEECFQAQDLEGLGRPARTASPTDSTAPTVSSPPIIKPTRKPTKAPIMAPDSGAYSTKKQGVFTSVVLGGAVLLLLLGQ
jgi:hypothetical protein